MKRFGLLLLRKSHSLQNVSAFCYWESFIVCATFQPFVIEKISWSAQRFSLLLLKYSHSLRNVLVFSIFYKSNLSYCSHTFSA